MESRPLVANPPFDTSGGDYGSRIAPVHTVRGMTVYPIMEAELKTLQMYTRDVTWYYSLASFLFGFGIQFAWERVTSNDEWNNFRIGAALACLISAGALGLRAKSSADGRSDELEEIKKSAVVIQVPIKVKADG